MPKRPTRKATAAATHEELRLRGILHITPSDELCFART
jgi:hypothetical protein